MSNNNPPEANKKKKGLIRSLREWFYFLKDNRRREIRKHFQTGIGYVQKNDYVNAEKAFLRIIDVRPDHFLAHLCLARLYRIRGENEKALKEYSSLKKINFSRYKEYNLRQEHMKASYCVQNKGLLTELADSLERCARNLTDAAKKMQGAAKNQKRTIKKLSNLNKKFKIKSLDVKNVEIKIGEYGDFQDLSEYVKFMSLPPISEKEVENTDWNKIISEILK
jgi:lipopolysaccharide biosynthesis regulator YciM